MVDALDSKSSGSIPMRVRVPPSVPNFVIILNIYLKTLGYVF